MAIQDKIQAPQGTQRGKCQALPTTHPNEWQRDIEPSEQGKWMDQKVYKGMITSLSHCKLHWKLF